jgi:hypothetical protein
MTSYLSSALVMGELTVRAREKGFSDIEPE